ncbi:Colicin V secretion/processing ATP-binding protein CvaB [Paenibacillus nuruki]|uniref:Colicin V secretion/processing ATP-binding protein CvaB n=1 Tax=Paenibacillus nuruki TaxID=1886670 RepID=A0A1E3L5X4_9BACL|nr:ABC transporter ATP-binding protein [Paenibacillus nuruki]ODP29232.1 Colicin V secretion/processing ATP-binding protein CvaB [Paenibacillus nuruki]
MNAIRAYMRQLHDFAGKRLYIYVFLMLMISCLDGLSIYLLVPLLSLVGLFGTQGSMPMAWLFEPLQRIPASMTLFVVLGMYSVLMIVQGLIQRRQAVMGTEIQQGFVNNLRIRTYRSILRANWTFFLRKRKSDLSHVLTSELARVSQGTNLVMQLSTSLIFMVIQIAFAMFLSVQMTLLVIIGGVLLTLYSRKFVRRAKRMGDRTTFLSQEYFSGMQEHLSGIKDIKSNMLEASHFEWFRSMCGKLEQNAIQLVRLNSGTQFIYKIISVVFIILFVVLSAQVFKLQPERSVLIILIFARLWPRFGGIQSSLEYIGALVPAFHAVTALQQECDQAEESYKAIAPGQVERVQMTKGLSCEDVSFRYQEDQGNALHNINLFIPIGKMTAIVGRSGAGKSTLIDLLMGLMEPQEGKVTVDGVTLTGERLQTWRNSIGYVSQEPFLFHSSIRENLLLVDPRAKEEQLWEALSFAACEDFVRKLPEGLDTIIGDRGVRLSGGERQRIVLARAILRQPEVLILDEATSSLDSENEAKIQAAIEKLKGKMTLIVIAHRLSTIRDADQVVVLDQGQIVQQGEFGALSRETKGTFHQLLAKQTAVQNA